MIEGALLLWFMAAITAGAIVGLRSGDDPESLVIPVLTGFFIIIIGFSLFVTVYWPSTPAYYNSGESVAFIVKGTGSVTSIGGTIIPMQLVTIANVIQYSNGRVITLTDVTGSYSVYGVTHTFQSGAGLGSHLILGGVSNAFTVDGIVYSRTSVRAPLSTVYNDNYAGLIVLVFLLGVAVGSVKASERKKVTGGQEPSQGRKEPSQ